MHLHRRARSGRRPERDLRRRKRKAVLQLLVKVFSVETFRARRRLRRYRARPVTPHDRLQELISFSVTRVPYYRTACAALSAEGGVDFSRLPILNKAAMRENFADLVAVGRAGAVLGQTPLWIMKTSGSTGVPSSYLKSKADLLANNSALASIFAEYGVRPYGHLFDLGLHRKDQTIVEARAVPGAFVCWNFTGYSFDRSALRKESLAIIACARPRVIYGAASRLVSLARLCESEGLDLRPALVMSSYEHLPTHGAALLRRVFGCPVVQIYGTAETGPVAWTCSLDRWHFDPRLVAVELVDAQGAYVSPGQTGRLVVTLMDLRVMPLLRFDTGDLAVCPETACPCGKAAPSVEDIEGRAAAMIETVSGERFSPFAVFGYVNALGVTDAQIVQRRPGELRLVFPADVTIPAATQEDVQRSIRRYLGEETDVTFCPDGRFVYTPSGKRNLFVGVSSPQRPGE